MNMKYVTLFAATVLSFNAFAGSPWGTDPSGDTYMHFGLTADACKPYASEVVDYLYEDENNEFYGYMHRNHPLGETEEQGFYGFSRELDQDSKNSFGCSMIYVSYDATNEGDYKSKISFVVLETAISDPEILIDTVVKQ